jgi:hypothetical protein
MPRRVLVILGHPDGNPKRLCRALADAYAEAGKNGFAKPLLKGRSARVVW